ncbi:MAG: LacI family transcriptional regulator [Actinomycetales bacterium]|nr:LacI family transcriptional regulator [Actinomycetales bacterium]
MSRAKAGRPRPASVKDVASRAGVSVGTVSNVLNRPDRVSEATRQRVEQAMAELGFIRNESARQLRAGKSRSLAYVMLDASNPFFTDVAMGIEDAAARASMSTFLCHSGGDAARERTQLQLLEQQRVQGILITPVDPGSAVIDEIRARGTHVVIVDRTRQGDTICSVSVDDELGGRLAVEHLIDRGHRRVAFVGGPHSIGQVRDRWAGASEAWRAAGLPEDDLVRLDTERLSVDEGRVAGQRIAGLSTRRRPTAAFCANDLLALGLLQQAVTTGRRVPDDLAIIGYDDIEFAAAAAVPLTSVRQPRQQLGETAARLILDETDNPDHQHESVVFTPELVARRSTLG